MKLNRFVAWSLALTAAVPGLATAAPTSPSPLHSQAWDDAHLGASGLAKCHAFRELRQETSKLQKGGDGALPVEWRRHLETQLAAAKSMPPRSLTAAQCGVPL
jgi:hypothetical protein